MKAKWSIGACECSTLSLGTNKDVFPTDKGVFHLVGTDKGVSFISFWCRVHRYIHFASSPLSALSHPLSIQQNFQMGNNADVKLIFPLTAATVNLSQEADPVKLRRNTFMRSSYIVNKQKKAVWADCSAASVLNPNNVCVSRG